MGITASQDYYGRCQVTSAPDPAKFARETPSVSVGTGPDRLGGSRRLSRRSVIVGACGYAGPRAPGVTSRPSPTSRTIEGMTETSSASTESTFERVRAFLDDIRFATIATLDPDGAPRQAVVWYTLDGDEIILNSRVGRRWPSNLLRDSRITLAVIDAAAGERWVGVNGRVTVVEDQATAQADIAGMARRYEIDDPAEAERAIRDVFQQQTRISFRLPAISIVNHLD